MRGGCIIVIVIFIISGGINIIVIISILSIINLVLKNMILNIIIACIISWHRSQSLYYLFVLFEY